MRVPAGLSCLSNMPASAVTTDASLAFRVFEFMDTPVMSTYLLAFVVGEFDSISRQTSRGVVVSVHTPLTKAAQGRHALHVASRALDFYERLFGIPYPLPKMVRRWRRK